ncbi:MAG: anthranilate synthase component I family protein [Firmicutes bacterium]|nr:anthranilate synthase component I family protein [Bacillota bacterium]
MVPDPSTFEHLARQGGLVAVYTELVADLETPITLYLKLVPLGACYLLESAEAGERPGRYSIVGLDPVERLVCRGEVSPFAALQSLMGRYRVAAGAGLPPFYGGAVGYIAYDAVRHLEPVPLPARPTGWPEAEFVVARTVCVYDHLTHRLYIVTLADPQTGTAAAYDAAVRELERVQAVLRRPVPEAAIAAREDGAADSRLGAAREGGAADSGPGEAPPAARAVPERAHAGDGAPAARRTSLPRAAFTAAVRRALAAIRAGEAFQVVLAQQIERPLEGDPFEVYRALRSLNPSPYLFYLDFGERRLAGSSPETLVKVEDGRVDYRPIAGTRPRGGSPDEDARLAAELAADEKERAEHVMLVDLGRNDLGRVCRPGTVKVERLMAVERYSHVMHLVSYLSGELRPEVTPLDALAACFPAGTLTGAPKVRAMQLISELEPERRGPYGGAVGYVAFNGHLDFCIAIRTVAMAAGRARIGAGAGVVALSDPDREYEETMHKARALERALDLAAAAARDDAAAPARDGAAAASRHEAPAARDGATAAARRAPAELVKEAGA